MKRLWVMMLLLASLFVPLASARANGDVTIKDDANVLSPNDRATISGAAQKAPFGVVVWTANGGYAGSKDAFMEAANAMAGRDEVVIAVDPVDRLSHIVSNRTGLDQASTNGARTEANASFGHRAWGAGIMAALGHLNSVAPAAGAYGYPTTQYRTMPYNSYGGYGAPYGRSSGGGLSFFWIILLVIGAVLFFRFLGRSNRGGYGVPMGGGWGRPGWGGSGWGGGGGGLFSGLLGGLFGYEIGREMGQRDVGYPGGGFVPDNTPSNDGGFVQSDWGGSGADFGGGGTDFGGGGDAGGGGASTDF